LEFRRSAARNRVNAELQTSNQDAAETFSRLTAGITAATFSPLGAKRGSVGGRQIVR